MKRQTLTALLFLAAAGLAGAQTEAERIDYLNRHFAGDVWPDARAIIGDHLIHEVRKDLENRGLTLDTSKTSANLVAPPGFRAGGPGLLVRFPAIGHYEIRVRAEKEIAVITNPSIDMTIRIAITIPVGPTSAGPADTSDTTIDADVDLPTAEAAAVGLLTGGAGAAAIVLAAGQIFEEILDGVAAGTVSDLLAGRIQSQLGFFSTMRWDPSVSLTYGSPDRELVAGHRELDPAHAIDLFLIGDGYGAGNLIDLDSLAASMAAKVRTADPTTRVSEPYAAFASAIRVWSLRVQTASPGDDRHRIVTSFLDPVTGSSKTAFANLARLAAVGIRARALGADVLVFVARRTGSLSPAARASAFGPLVLQPDTSDSPTVLLHELGHTILGRLADEYQDRSEAYRGFEPAAVNVTTRIGAAILPNHKWHFWATGLAAHGEAWDRPVGDFAGGYLFQSGVFRPSLDCKMRSSGGEVPFCPVCREALALGLSRRVASPSALVEVAYQSPWTEGPLRFDVPTSGGSGARSLDAYPGIQPTRLSMRLVASGLPEPWNVRWLVYSDATSTFPFTSTGPAPAPFRVQLGGRVVLELSSGCRYLPRHGFAPIRIEFRFDRPRTPSVDPDPPTSLSQSVALGARIPVDYDPVTGDVRFSLSLSSAPGRLPGWDLETRVEYRLSGPIVRSVPGAGAAAGTATPVRVAVLPAGIYTWEARTVFGQGASLRASRWASLAAPWALVRQPDGSWRWIRRHFEVASPTYAATAQPPRSPFDVRSSLPLVRGGAYGLSASSFDANGDAVRLQFEVKPQGTAFDGRGLLDSGLLSPALESLRVSASVAVGPYPSVHRWRVRAVDATGRASAWVDGGQVGGTTLTGGLLTGEDLETIDKLEAFADEEPWSPEPDPWSIWGWK